MIPAGGSPYDLVQRTDLSATVRHIRTRTTGGTVATRFEYLHRDHLGSVDAVTSASGTVLDNKMSFDAFGGRRAKNWASDISSTDLTTLLTNEDERWARGFTEHEMLNRTGFVHMNGRVYDPRIGRFVSPDPIVQAPTFSQSYNRYAYVFNSPLSITDPSGFIVEDPGDQGYRRAQFFKNAERRYSLGENQVASMVAGVIAGAMGAPTIVAMVIGKIVGMIFGKHDITPGARPALTGMASVQFGSVGIGGFGGDGGRGGSGGGHANTAPAEVVDGQWSGAPQGSVATTAAERQMLARNEVIGYYNSRAARGDAYASLALDVVYNRGVLGRAANVWMFSVVAFSMPDSEKARLLGDGTYIDHIRRVNIDLANQHMAAVDADLAGVRGQLSTTQISQYHERYFQSLGLPRATFGGSAFFGVRTNCWCSSCDSVP